MWLHAEHGVNKANDAVASSFVPNAQIELGSSTIVLRALCRIPKGTEILSHYGARFWHAAGVPNLAFRTSERDILLRAEELRQWAGLPPPAWLHLETVRSCPLNVQRAPWLYC